MPRTADLPGQPARNRVQVLLTDTDVAALDQARGATSQSAYLRQIVRGVLGPGHVHTPGKIIAETRVKNRVTTHYRCAHPGCKAEIKEET